MRPSAKERAAAKRLETAAAKVMATRLAWDRAREEQARLQTSRASVSMHRAHLRYKAARGAMEQARAKYELITNRPWHASAVDEVLVLRPGE